MVSNIIQLALAKKDYTDGQWWVTSTFPAKSGLFPCAWSQAWEGPVGFVDQVVKHEEQKLPFT